MLSLNPGARNFARHTSYAHTKQMTYFPLEIAAMENDNLYRPTEYNHDIVH